MPANRYTFMASTISKEQIVLASNIRLADDQKAEWEAKTYAKHECPRVLVFRQDNEQMVRVAVVTCESIYDWNS